MKNVDKGMLLSVLVLSMASLALGLWIPKYSFAQGFIDGFIVIAALGILTRNKQRTTD